MTFNLILDNLSMFSYKGLHSMVQSRFQLLIKETIILNQM